VYNLNAFIGASLWVAINAVKKGAAAEGMTVWDYVWRGHDPTSVAVMTEVIQATSIQEAYHGFTVKLRKVKDLDI